MPLRKNPLLLLTIQKPLFGKWLGEIARVIYICLNPCSELKKLEKEARVRWKKGSLGDEYDAVSFSSFFCANNLLLLEKLIRWEKQKWVGEKSSQVFYCPYWLKMSSTYHLTEEFSAVGGGGAFLSACRFLAFDLRINHNWCSSSFLVYFLVMLAPISGVVIRYMTPTI